QPLDSARQGVGGDRSRLPAADLALGREPAQLAFDGRLAGNSSIRLRQNRDHLSAGGDEDPFAAFDGPQRIPEVGLQFTDPEGDLFHAYTAYAYWAGCSRGDLPSVRRPFPSAIGNLAAKCSAAASFGDSH